MNIIIADDDMLIREGLKIILASQSDFDIIGIAENGKEALRLCEDNRVDVALLDIRMPVLDGITAAEEMLKRELCRPLLLSTFDERDFIIRALKAGVCGYILKSTPTDGILSAIRTVYSKGTVFEESILTYIRESMINSGGSSAVFELLTERELQIVQLIADGLSNQEIADKLYLSNGTVRNYISVILEKTGLEHRTQIAVRYLKG